MKGEDWVDWPREWKEKYYQKGYWKGIALAEAVLKPECGRLAVEGPDGRMSYRQLAAYSLRIATALGSRGLKPGDTAVVQLENSCLFYAVFFGLLRIGVRPVLTLWAHRRWELESFAEQLQPKLWVLSCQHPNYGSKNELEEAQDQAVPGSRFLWCPSGEIGGVLDELFGASVGQEEQADLPEISAESIAFFQLSGGSTATPKLIPRTHNDYLYSVSRSAEICGLDESVRYLSVLPAGHNFTLSSPGALGVLLKGGRVVCCQQNTPERCFELIERSGVTMTAVVPALLQSWIRFVEERGWAPSGLRVLQIGGAHCSVELAAAAERRLRCRVQQVFGMAEGLVCYTELSAPKSVSLYTQGRPMCADDEISVRDEAGEEVEVGEAGVLWTRGPYTVRGYWRSTDHNRKVFDSRGFYCTGDKVRVLPHGYLVVEGRIKEQINRGGEKIAAPEVEAALCSHPQILQAALLPVSDERFGEKSCAVLVCSGPPPEPHQLRRFLREKGLAAYKIPDQFIHRSSLPLTGVGKIHKKTLSRQIGGLHHEVLP